MLDVGQHVLGHEIAFGDVGVARQDEGLDADLLVRLQLGHDLIGVTDDRRTRTDPDVPKHKGLTFFLVPFDTPGIEIQPVPTMATERSNATFYDDVRLSDDWRVGEVNGGWAVMKTALKYERGIAGGQFMSPPVIDAGIDWATNHERADGTRPIDDPAVRELSLIHI